jgi:hypothetical protein
MQPLLHASGWIADDAVGQHEAMDAEAYKLVVTGESVSGRAQEPTSIEAVRPARAADHEQLSAVKDSSDAVYNRTLVLPMRWCGPSADAARSPSGHRRGAGRRPGIGRCEGWHRLKARGWYDPPCPGDDAALASSRARTTRAAIEV